MLDPVTVRYAEALFNLARSRGQLDRVLADVEGLARELEKPGVAAFLFDERISLETRREKTRGLFTGCELFGNFVNLLFDKRRVEVLRDLRAAFHRRMLAERNRAEGVVESARPLGTQELAAIARGLGGRLAKELALENRVVPELVGGVRVIVENRMIDFSLSGRLASLRKRMLEAPLPVQQEP